MFSHLKQMLRSSEGRRRKTARQFRVEDLEGRQLLTATPINLGITVESAPVVVNGELFFTAKDATHGTQLWESNGTASGTTMLTDLNVKNGGPDPQDLTAVGNTLFFSANDGPDGDQLWESNGTASGTVMLSDVTPNYGGCFPSDLTAVAGTLYFTAYSPSDGMQLFKSNGTAGGTVMVADINGTSGAAPANLTASGSTLYFTAADSTDGTQLWKSNGTAGGTVRLTTNDPTSGGLVPAELTAVGNTLYFVGYDPDRCLPALGDQRHGRRRGADHRRQRQERRPQPVEPDGGGQHPLLHRQRRHPWQPVVAERGPPPAPP